MPSAIAYSVLILALVGHAVFWVALVNRIHALAWPRRIIDGLTQLCGAVLLAVPAGFALFCNRYGLELLTQGLDRAPIVFIWVYIAWCIFVAVVAGFKKMQFAWRDGATQGLISNHTTVIDFRNSVDEPLMAPGLPALLARLPRNEVLKPHFHEKQIAIPRLRIDNDEIRIAHLSDFHMSGRIRRRYFEEIVGHVNAWEPDLIALTGDLVEHARCLDWIPNTLGQLRARQGVYFVLGNHDRRVNTARLRQLLIDSGLIDVAGRWCLVKIRQTSLALAGNECPWFSSAPDMSDCPRHDATGRPVRVLLSHSPDQYIWGQEREMDLVLAGHCHGGQVRFPVVGAILSPSMHGTRYSAGVFQSGATVMHVSRGTSGLAPIRWNCPPEVALLTLRSGSS